MKRHPQWERRLASFIEENADRPHSYGRFDCIMFPLGAAQAITGIDKAKRHRGKYEGQTGALRYLKKLGFETPEQALDSILTPKSASFAQRGDVVLAKDGIPAVCMGGYALSAGQEGDREGLVRVPREDWVKAWEVGEQFATAPKPKRRKVKWKQAD